MGALLLQMVLYGAAAACAAPIAVVLSALILAQSKRPQASVWTLTGRAPPLLDIVMSVAVLVIYFETSAESGDAAAYLDIGLGAVFFAFGVTAIFSTETLEKDAAPRPRRAHRLGALPAMFVFGIVVQIINIDALAASPSASRRYRRPTSPPARRSSRSSRGSRSCSSATTGSAVFAALSPTRARSISPAGRPSGLAARCCPGSRRQPLSASSSSPAGSVVFL